MRKSGLKLDGYPNMIHPDIIRQLTNKAHPLAKIPIYNKLNEPESYHEELIASKRYKFIMDEMTRVFECDVRVIPNMNLMMMQGMLAGAMMQAEHPHKRRLEDIAERIIREEFNLGQDEVLFDIEIIDMPYVKMPPETEKEKINNEDQEFKDDVEAEIVKRRVSNALMQGAAKKGHFMFHMASEELEQLMPGIIDIYKKVILTNDLMYYLMGDPEFEQMIEQDMISSYVKLNFDGDVPVIEAKAFSFPILVHEMVKGVIELLAVPGLPKDKELALTVLEECDYVKAEPWDCRLGPEFWTAFYSLIDIDDYPIKKLIIRDVFKLPAEDFNQFMYNVLSFPDKAKREINNIVSFIKGQISDYQFIKDEDEDLPDVDFTQFFN